MIEADPLALEHALFVAATVFVPVELHANEIDDEFEVPVPPLVLQFQPLASGEQPRALAVKV